ncbi:fad binding domain-containing protein [Moniliophthora roreri MCA 2997]|uniref:Fad binding domain-containing protein n=2 Tax=Moniliophthora roreri TaxID=221103 RepID=V2XRD6_MONRO|nr:fad binding domain-containing protein [Moniliophthora roreri MCA 2997]KAI3611456.1 fad binding domain-containing protein [Moniliophthora roreri]
MSAAVNGEHPSQYALDTETRIAVEQCCSEIAQRWPTLVSSNPKNQYYASQQVDIRPKCCFTPLSPTDVSSVVCLLNEHRTPFAVRSGGHGVWAGQSNIEGGFVVDLSKMRGIQVDLAQNLVKLQPGTTWEEVFKVLDPQNITVAAGRVSSVGVGGFLMGGGISFTSYERGFASDSIINYEVVLADGTIVEANANSHPDLYWALKLGSTNYGIVTRFDMIIYPAAPQIWAGTHVYSLAEKEFQRPLLKRWLSSIENLSVDPKMASLININGHAQVMALIRIYLEPETSDLSPYTSTPPIADTMAYTTTAPFIKSIEGVCGINKRVSWFTMTVSAELALIEELIARTQAEAAALGEKYEAELYTTLQPINKGWIAASEGSPVHKVLAEKDDEDLILVLWYALWDNPAHDALIDSAIVGFGESAEELARQRGLLNGFVYLNYANQRQKVYERSVSKDNLAKMIGVREKYDKENVFGRLWRGGYKLPRTS